MTPERWREVTRIYGAVVSRAPEQRAAAIAELCRGDEELRLEIDALLADDSGTRLLDKPVTDIAEALVEPDLTGRTLGPYRIEKAIGEGGMGRVYRALDIRLHRAVALKVLGRTLAQDPQFRARFDREAKSIAALNHPHICTLHDVGTHDGIDYLVMEYVEGETLATRLERGALPFEQAHVVAVQIAEALAAAHRQGIVHRDLKPGNVMLTKAGVKLLDFGLAKPSGHPTMIGALSMLPTTPPAGPTRGAPLTAQGAILGTVQYMAPEQLEGKEADARTDIFAFGTVTYEMFTGQKAFEGKSQASLIGAIMHAEPPPMTTRQPLTPPVLERIVRTCLAKDPDERWQSAADLARELKTIGRASGDASPDVKGWRRANAGALVITAVLSALIAVFVTTWSLRTPAVGASVTRFTISPPSGVHLNTAYARIAAISPDGRRLVMLTVSDGVSQLSVRPLDADSASPVPGTQNAIGPAWAPDSRRIAFVAEGKLKVVDVVTHAAQVVCDVSPSASGIAWMADDSILFGGIGVVRTAASGQAVDSALARRPIMRVSLAGQSPVAVTAPDPNGDVLADVWPVALPDGRHFLYVSRRRDLAQSAVFVGSIDSSERTFVMNSSAEVQYAAPGYLLFLRDRALMAQPFDAAHYRMSGEAVMVANDITSLSNGAVDFTTSQTGVLVHRAGQRRQETQLTWFDRKGMESRVSAVPVARMLDVELDADGRRLAFTQIDPTRGTSDVFVHDFARGTTTPLTFDAADEFSPRWSPDGSEIGFVSNRSDAPGIYAVPSAGGAEHRIMPVQAYSGIFRLNDWTTRALVFSGAGQASDIWVAPPGTQATKPVVGSTFDEKEGRLSPNGRWLAYSSNQVGAYQVFLRSMTASGQWQVSTTGGSEPRWRKDGRELYFLTVDGRIMAVALDETAESPGLQRPVEIARTSVGIPTGIVVASRSDYSVTADGQRFIVAVPTQSGATDDISVVLNWPTLVKQ